MSWAKILNWFEKNIGEKHFGLFFKSVGDEDFLKNIDTWKSASTPTDELAPESGKSVFLSTSVSDDRPLNDNDAAPSG
jgi:hypothetical protein